MPHMPQIVLLIETSKAFGRNLMHGIGRYIWENRPWAIYLEERGKNERPPTWLREWQGDGIIAHSNSEKMVEFLLSKGLPVVETDMKGMDMGVPIIYSNEDKLADLAVDHFLERGLGQMTFCTIVKERWTDFRKEAFLRAAERQDVTPCELFERSGTKKLEWTQQRETLIDWLKRLPKPIGVWAANDACGMRVLDACRIAEIPVPEQVAVLGTDNDPVICNLTSPPMSSLNQDVDRIGYEAAALLDRMMAGEPAPEQPIFVEPLCVVARQSTDILAIEDEEVAMALKFIRQRACEGIDVQNLLQHVPISRSSLERRFQQFLHRSPKAEIMRVKMNRARLLLAQSDLTIARIAERCGFSTPQYFANVFLREFQITPRDYRLQSTKASGVDSQVSSANSFGRSE